MENVQHDYYMFCDQDDVWLPNKIELTLNEMINLEDSNKIEPLLVFSDLIIVNHKLEIISTSLWNYWNISCIMYPEKYLYATPLITGCTMMFNHKAKIVSLKYSKKAIMHDSLIALSVLSNSGKIKAISESLIFYRQHDNNVLGALSVNNTFLLKVKNIKHFFKSNVEYYCFSNYMTGISFFKFLLLRIEIIIKRFFLRFKILNKFFIL
jgi:hypothetical protein